MGDNAFIAMQASVVGIPVRRIITLKGPPTEVIRLASGAEYTAELKRIRIEKYADEITDSVERTITTKFSSEISSKLASEFGASNPLSSDKLSSEVQVKSGVELASAVRQSLAVKRSFEVQESQEVRRSVTYKAPHDTVLQFHLEFWPWRWEFYVYRAELLSLRYQHHWLWRDVRETLEKRVVRANVPLFAVLFYEPQDTQSITVDSYTPDVTGGDEIRVEALTATPATLDGPVGQSLEDLARLAFPTTRSERRTARARKKAAARAKKGAAPKAGAKQRVAAKKKAAGRASAKRGQAKKVAAWKAGLKKSVARKAGSKKSAARMGRARKSAKGRVGRR